MRGRVLSLLACSALAALVAAGISLTSCQEAEKRSEGQSDTEVSDTLLRKAEELAARNATLDEVKRELGEPWYVMDEVPKNPKIFVVAYRTPELVVTVGYAVDLAIDRETNRVVYYSVNHFN